jgi:hypothetical protein
MCVLVTEVNWQISAAARKTSPSAISLKRRSSRPLAAKANVTAAATVRARANPAARARRPEACRHPSVISSLRHMFMGAPLDQQVAGLHVAVHQSPAVRGVQGTGAVALARPRGDGRRREHGAGSRQPDTSRMAGSGAGHGG